MRRSWTRVALLAAASVALAAPSFAHHSLSMYNINTKKFLTGTVKEFEWANPHSFIRILVRKSDGMTELWSFEGAGVGSLSRVGWSKDMMHPGDTITVRYSPRTDGADGGGLFQSVETADGKTWVSPFGQAPNAASGR